VGSFLRHNVDRRAMLHSPGRVCGSSWVVCPPEIETQSCSLRWCGKHKTAADSCAADGLCVTSPLWGANVLDWPRRVLMSEIELINQCGNVGRVASLMCRPSELLWDSLWAKCGRRLSSWDRPLTSAAHVLDC